MDARIGYPTEHLANTNNEMIKSPMYATGIGLVMKGFEEAQQQGNTEVENDSTEQVKTHSTKKLGKFFEGFLKKGLDLFEEKED